MASPGPITVACLDMAGTTVADDGSVIAAFSAAVEQFGLPAGTPGYDEALEHVYQTMGQSKIEAFRRGGPAARRGADHRGSAGGRDQGLPGHRVLAGDQGRAARRAGLAAADRPGAVARG